jgi:hypothetical protein
MNAKGIAHQEEYPAIAARAKVENAEIHWGDESGIRSESVISKYLRGCLKKRAVVYWLILF